jgi:hypothetical protein
MKLILERAGKAALGLMNFSRECSVPMNDAEQPNLSISSSLSIEKSACSKADAYEAAQQLLDAACVTLSHLISIRNTAAYRSTDEVCTDTWPPSQAVLILLNFREDVLICFDYLIQ